MAAFEHVNFTSDDIGLLLLESITRGLYTDARHCIREYIQNEYDAGAETVFVDVEGRAVSIMGDSQGMTKDELLAARRIGFSGKDPNLNAGFRGIGIWSGVSVCQTLDVISKSRGSGSGYFLRIDAKGLRDAIRRRDQIPLVQALRDNVYIRQVGGEETQQKFGTRVHLVDVLPEHDRILNQAELRGYLSQVAPVAMNSLQSIAKPVLDKLASKVPGYREIVVRVNAKPVYRPPARETELQPPTFHVIETDDHRELGFVWYAMNTKAGNLDPEERGLVYKCKGFMVGDPERNTVKKLEPGAATQQLSGWVCGEIHLLDPFLVPNSERVDLETNTTSDFFRNRVRELLRRIEKEVRHFSEKRSAESHVYDAQRILDEIASATDLQTKVVKFGELQHPSDLLGQDLASPKTTPEMKPRVERVLREVNRVKKEIFEELKIPEVEPKEDSSKKRKALAKQTEFSEEVDKSLPGIITAFKLGGPQEQLLRDCVAALRVSGVSEGKILRFLEELQRKLGYRRIHPDAK